MNNSKEEVKKPAVIGIFKKIEEGKPKKRVVVRDMRDQSLAPKQQPPSNQPISSPLPFQKSNFHRQPALHLRQVIDEYNKAEDQLLNQYYSKRHLLLGIFSKKTANNGHPPQATPPLREKQLSKTTTDIANKITNKSLTVIPIFAKVDKQQHGKSHILPKQQLNPINQQNSFNNQAYSIHHPMTNYSPRHNNNISFRMKTDHCLNFTLGNSVGSDHEPNIQSLEPSINNMMAEDKEEQSYDSTEESFYSVYLKVQEDKLTQQRETVMKLTSRIHKDQQQLGYIEVESAYGGSHIAIDDHEELEQPQVKFGFVLAETISIEQHRDILKNKLKYKMFQVFRLMGFTEFTITRRQFIDSLVRLMDQTNMQRQDMEHISQLIFQGKLQITRQEFSTVFKCQTRNGSKLGERLKDDLIEDDTRSLRSCSSRTQATMDYLKKFFADCNMIGYFQTKLRNLVKEKGGMVVSNLFNEISNSRQFEQMDIFYYLHNKIKTSIEPTSIALFLDRIMLRQKNGKFNKNDFYLWLTNR